MAVDSGNKMTLLVVTPYKNFYEGEVSSVTIPTPEGEIGILAGHSPLVVALEPGVCMVRVGEDVKHFTCSEGYAEIGQKKIIMVCNSAEWPETIDLIVVFESYNIAKEKLSENSDIPKDDYEIRKDYERSLARAKSRIHMIELYGDDKQQKRLSEFKQRYGL